MEGTFHRDIILGTAGHIDHGKSSLVKALTGVDPDRLLEEKNRGITIELGFAQLALDADTAFGVVDVPGHERFVRQMIAGSTGIDLALLCIAADDGVMPQTIEHVAILELLGITRAVVALTKIDAVDAEWVSFMSDEVASFLSDTSLANAPVVPVSSMTGEGIDALKQALKQAATDVKALRNNPGSRLPVDRVFTIKGSGTVVTGTLWSGTVSIDDELELLPSKQTARVRSVQVHGKSVPCAQAGNRVALNLNAIKTSEVRPGDFLASPGLIEPTDRADVFFTYHDVAQSGKPLKSGSRVHIAHGTREVIGRLVFMDGKESLLPSEISFGQIRLEKKLPLSLHDRFVVRSYSPVSVIGGGQVLDCHPRRRTTLSDNERALLEAINADNNEVAIERIALLYKMPSSAETIASRIGLDLELTQKVLAALAGTKGIISLEGPKGEPLYTQQRLIQKYEAAIERELTKFHADNPTQPGIAKLALMPLVDKRLTDEAFDAALQKLQAEGKVVVNEGLVSHPKARAGAQQHEDLVAKVALEALTNAATAPPLIAELAKQIDFDEGLVRRVLGTLQKEGKVQMVSTDLCFEAGALKVLENRVVEYLNANGEATVAQLKDAMETTRKYAVPLLEYFDNKGRTIRKADTRVLK